MPTRSFAVFAVLALFTSAASVAVGQGRGGGGGMGGGGFSSGALGSGGMGMGGFGGGLGSSGLGSSFGSGFGSGGMGSGSSSFGNMAGFGSSRFGSSGFGSAGFGGSQYGGGGQNGGQNFVGRSGTDMQGVFGQTSKAQNQFLNQLTRSMGGRNNNSSRRKNSNNTAQSQNSAQPMRMAVEVGFDPPRQTSAQLAASIRTRVSKILVEHHKSVPGLIMEGDTAVLSGVAASESDRDVIAMLVSLEPGVRSVRNEMTIAGQPAVIAPAAPGSGS